MRRLFPFLIVAVGLAALAIDFVPNLSRPGTSGDVKIETRLGLDLQGGISVEYQAVTTNGAAPGPGDMSTIQTIIENRVNSTGVSEPLVQILGADKVIVEVPGAADPDEIRKLVGTTGRLDFVNLPPDVYGTGGATPTTGTKPVPQQGEAIDPTLPVLFSGDQIDPSGVAPGIDSTTDRAGRAVQAQGHRRRRSSPPTPPTTWATSSPSSSTAPSCRHRSIQSPIPNGSGQITGNFTVADMNNLVTVLKYGALPVRCSEISESQVSATLGADFLRQTLLAGAIGILLVFFFMLVYYRLPGVVACVALIFYAVVVYALFRLDPGDAHVGRRRRLRPLGGHGGRRQHPHLRAYQGGAAVGQDGRRRPSRRASTGPGTRSWTRTSRASSRPRSCTWSGHRRSAASPWSSSSACSSRCSPPSPSAAPSCAGWCASRGRARRGSSACTRTSS